MLCQQCYVVRGMTLQFSDWKCEIKLHIGSENHQVFDFICIHFEQKPDFNQNSYTKTISPIPVTKRIAHTETSFDDALGKLNWLIGMTRTEISFEVCQINTRVKNPIVAGILPVNKVMKSTSNSIGIPNLNLKSLSLQMQTLTTYHKG